MSPSLELIFFKLCACFKKTCIQTLDSESHNLFQPQSGQPDSSTLKEIVQSERLGAALDTEKTRAEKLAQRAAAAEKQLKMAVRKNRVLAMENHLAIQKLHSLGVRPGSRKRVCFQSRIVVFSFLLVVGVPNLAGLDRLWV